MDAYESGHYITNPNEFFPLRKSVCSGYSSLFKRLLLAMNYTESKIKYIHGYSKGYGYSPYEKPKSNHEWNAVEINGQWCLIDTTWDAGRKSEYYLFTPPKCFVRDHLPEFEDELKFLEKPITLEKFHSLVQTKESYCDYNIEIIEDKYIQNLCGKGKIIIKCKSDEEYNHLTITPDNNVKMPQYFVNKIENGFDIDIYI